MTTAVYTTLQDSEGKRYGKVIDYKVSELRAVELMEDLCNVLNQYDLLWLEANHTSAVWGQPGWTWVKMRGDGAVHGAVSKYEVVDFCLWWWWCCFLSV